MSTLPIGGGAGSEVASARERREKEWMRETGMMW